ncbi:MAG: DegT/DnrJ/EryC1/StrS family aminotransferase [Coriobacteriia bacterium]|nr:DegT/DnrJ/EryC1/StrS family aminotransferase [Coriobacteriia bacterium]
MIPVYRPFIGATEKAYVADAVESTWISSKGAYLQRFEEGFAAFISAGHAVATCNGTVSLHLILEALGLGAGDEVIVPTLTYVASVNAITYTGATPVFVDSDPVHWNLDPADVAAKITPRTKAIMVVHLYGHPADMDPILALGREHGIPVIEDAAEAHGAEYRGRRVGAMGLAGSFSFFGNKIITTGEGGMVVSNDAEFAERCRHLRGQGVSPTRTYWHDVVGFNYRMTNIAAAIGVAQLERVDDVIETKRRLAHRYVEALADVESLTLPPEMPWARSVYWMVSVLVEPSLRDPLMAYLKERGIETRPFFYPAHTLPMYETSSRFPVAERLGASGINLPSFPELTDAEIDEVCAGIRGFMAEGAHAR